MSIMRIQLGKGLASLVQHEPQKIHFLQELKDVRKQLFRTYGGFSPSYTLECDEQLASYEYAFDLETFGRIVYAAEMWDVKKEQDFLFERILFHYERFLRKWYTDAPDVGVEETLKDRPLVIEYGEEWADVVENEAFFVTLKDIAYEFSILLQDPPYWESDYVKENQLVVYVYGKDHFVKQGIEKTKETFMNEVLVPILRENRLRIAHH